MTVPAFYATQGTISNPGKYTAFLDDMPDDIHDLCGAVMPLVFNDFLAKATDVHTPGGSEQDCHIRYLEDRLDCIVMREKNVVADILSLGNCRDISLFICTALRHKHIPARIRSGFATFFDPRKKFDHWLCEYWNDQDERWQRVDGWIFQAAENLPSLPPQFSEAFAALGLDALDVGPAFFSSGGKAWSLCREGKDDFENYGTEETGLEGEWFVRDNMIRDLFCLAKIEPLP